MNGIHDMGGMHGFGRVEPEPNEPPFHSRSEALSLALNRAMSFAKIWNIDRSRAAIEELPPRDYLTLSYYQKWALRLEKLLVEFGLVSAEAVAAARQGAAAHAEGRRGRESAHARLLCAANQYHAALRGRRSRAHAQSQPGHAYTAAALCPRPHRRDRMRAWVPCVPRHGRDRGRREPAVALHRAVRGPRAVGRERRSDAQGLERGRGALSGASMIDRAAAR